MSHGPPPILVQDSSGKGPLRRRHLAILSRGHGEGPILGQGEVGGAVVVPGELLGANGAVEIGRGVGGGLGVVDDIILSPIRAGGEAGVPRAVDALEGVLVKDAAIAVLAP